MATSMCTDASENEIANIVTLLLGLCIGATGSGKSEFLRTLVLGLLPLVALVAAAI